MRLLAIGDSFTYGEELPDLNKSWPHQLGKKLGYEVINLGEPASSNDSIIRRLMEYVITQNVPVDLVVIGWSLLGRQEFADEIGYYDVWPGYGGNLFIQDGATWRNDLCAYISKYHNREYYFLKFLQQVTLIQSFLKSKNINYVMMNVLENDYYKKKLSFFWEKYFEEIDKDKFLGFNHSGMIEWTQGLAKGPQGHFLEEGHALVADKVYEHIGNLGWIS
jgi:hypothetical protein